MADQLTSSDVGALARGKINTAIQQLNTLIGQLASLNQAVTQRALQADLADLSNEVDTKAAQSALDAIVGTIQGLQTQIGGKAAQTALDALVQAVGGKADKQAIVDLTNTVGTKAAQSALAALTTTVGSKASRQELLEVNDARIALAEIVTAHGGQINDTQIALGNEITARLNQILELRARATQVEAGLATTSALVASIVQHRPGDTPAAFTGSGNGGPAAALPAIPAGWVGTNENGKVAVLRGELLISRRRYDPIETGRLYAVGWAFQRRVDTKDPSDNTVQLGILWFDQNYLPLTGSARQTIVRNMDELRLANGRQRVTRTVAKRAGDGADVVAPANAAYARAFVLTYGADQQTDIEIIGWADVTDAQLFAPSVDAFDARLQSIEADNLPARLLDVESAVANPRILTFPTRADAQAADLSDRPDVRVIRLLGWAAADDRGAGDYARGTAQPDAGLFFNTLDGAVWVYAGAGVSLQQAGAVDDGLTPIDAAFARARQASEIIGLRKIGSGRYRVTTSPAFIGRVLDPDPGVTLEGPLNLDPTLRTLRPLRFNLEREDTPGVVDRYGYWFMPEWGDLPARKKVFLSGGDLDTSTVEAIDCSTALAFRKVFADGSDDWIADTVTAGGTDYVPFGLTTDGNWHVGFLPVRGGQEIFATFDAGQFVRGVFVRTTNGYHVLKAGDAGFAAFSSKIIGQPLETIENVGWLDLDINPVWQTNFAEYGLRIIDSRRVAFLINGVEVFRRTLTGEVIEAGFGVLFDRSGVVNVRSLSRVRTRQAVGVKPVVLGLFGDSRFANLHGSGDFWMKDALDGSLGIIVQSIDNRAVPGETSAQQLARMQAGSFGNITHTVIGVGTNDVQTLTDVATMVANIRAMITLSLNNFRPVVLVGFDLWYDKGTAPNSPGVTTYAARESARYRSALRRLAGEMGVRYLDLSKVNPVLRSLAGLDDRITDPRVRDNLHHTAYAYRINAVAIAQAVAAEVAPRMTQRIDDAPFPLAGPFNCLRNGWTATTAPPSYSVSEDGFVTAQMTLDAGNGANKADTTPIFQLPPNLLPSPVGGSVRTVGWTENGFAKLLINPAGQVIVYGMGGSSVLAFTVTYRAR